MYKPKYFEETDITIHTFSHGGGGQHVGYGSPPMTVHHHPSGTVVRIDATDPEYHRSQHKTRMILYERLDNLLRESDGNW